MSLMKSLARVAAGVMLAKGIGAMMKNAQSRPGQGGQTGQRQSSGGLLDDLLGSNTGGIIGDLTSRRGMVQGQDTRGNANVINAMVPLANMFGYINNLRSMSSGRAVFSMEFHHYDAVPENLSLEIQKKHA